MGVYLAHAFVALRSWGQGRATPALVSSVYHQRMRPVCAGTPVHYEQTVRERVVRPWRRMRPVCAGTPVHHERTVRVLWCEGLPRRRRAGAPRSAPPTRAPTCGGRSTSCWACPRRRAGPGRTRRSRVILHMTRRRQGRRRVCTRAP